MASFGTEDAGRGAVAEASSSPANSVGKLRPNAVAWVVLAVAVLAMSSGGLWFVGLRDAPGILRASWRLMVTSILQLPGFIRDYRSADPELRRKWKAQLRLLMITGAALACHFGAWSISVTATSLTHSLLLVSTTPLFMIGAAGLRYAVSRLYWRGGQYGTLEEPDRPQLASLPRPMPPKLAPWSLAALLEPSRCLPPTGLETAGTLLGFIGTAVLITSAEAASGAEAAVSLYGDVAAIIGAVSFWFYLLTGSKMRAFLPLWLYVFPVTAASAVTAAVVSLLFESGVHVDGFSATSLFGWLGDGTRFALVLGAAAGSGILGHTGMNYTAAHFPPLVISVVILWEPLIGSLLGWALGLQAVPGPTTLLATPLLLGGAVFTSIGGREGGITARQLWDKVRCVKPQQASSELAAQSGDASQP